MEKNYDTSEAFYINDIEKKLSEFLTKKFFKCMFLLIVLFNQCPSEMCKNQDV